MFELHDNRQDAVITGNSVHNQRIERFWRDVFEKETEYYYNIFQYLHHEKGYNFARPVEQFCLHFLFLPRINESMDECRRSWNIHKISTMGNYRPEQLLELGKEQSGANPVSFEAYHSSDDDDDDDDDEEEEEEEDLADGQIPQTASMSAQCSTVCCV
jgi:hypothetical protein